MATLYLKTAGGNWTDAAAWSTTSAAGGDSSGPPTAADDCIAELLSGNVTISGTSVGKSFSSTAGTGTWAGVFTHNAFKLTLSGALTFNSGMTYTPLATSTLAIIATTTLTTGGLLMSNIEWAKASGSLTLSDNLSFMASKIIVFTISTTSGTIDLNGKTVSGNSATNRLLVRTGTVASPTLGTTTASNFTIGSGTFANADFRDISASASKDLSAITGNSGDCGGNTNITFTNAATQTATGSSANWSAATWTSRAPLPQDDWVVSMTAGQTLTADMPRLGKSGSFTTATLFTLGINVTNYGSLDFTNSGTFAGNFQFIFEGRSAFNLTSAGKTFLNTTMVTMVGGSLTLNDAMITTAFNVLNGSFITAGFSVTSNAFNSTGSNTRAVNISSSTFTLPSTGAVWTVASTGMTFTSTGSTISITNTSASSKTFAGGGLTYNDLLISGGGSGAIIITGANTFNRIYTDGGGTKSITLPGSTTTTLISGLGLANGTNLITFTASAGSATVAKSGGGVVAWDYLNLTNIIASTASTWYAGNNSTDNGGNTNWIFTAVPSGTPNLMMMGVG